MKYSHLYHYIKLYLVYPLQHKSIMLNIIHQSSFTHQFILLYKSKYVRSSFVFFFFLFCYPALNRNVQTKHGEKNTYQPSYKAHYTLIPPKPHIRSQSYESNLWPPLRRKRPHTTWANLKLVHINIKMWNLILSFFISLIFILMIMYYS